MEEARTAKQGPWRRCYSCGSTGPWKKCGGLLYLTVIVKTTMLTAMQGVATGGCFSVIPIVRRRDGKSTRPLTDAARNSVILLWHDAVVSSCLKCACVTIELGTTVVWPWVYIDHSFVHAWTTSFVPVLVP